jgi:hypothetical protein
MEEGKFMLAGHANTAVGGRQASDDDRARDFGQVASTGFQIP